MLSTTRSSRLRASFDDTLSAEFWRNFFDPSSLTVKLKRAAKLSFRVEVVEQGLCLSTEPYSKREYQWQRKVLLCVDDVVWISATTLVPLTQLQPAARHLLLLKNRPLGELLFKDPHLQRSGFSCSWQGNLPVRQSTFIYLHSPIYLRECFHLAAINFFQEKN